MIVRVYGRANGAEIIFTRKEGDLWQTEVPANLEGEYIVDLWAENDAGRTSYVCRALFAISGHKLKVTVLERGYTGEVSLGSFLGGLGEGGSSPGSRRGMHGQRAYPGCPDPAGNGSKIPV